MKNINTILAGIKKLVIGEIFEWLDRASGITLVFKRLEDITENINLQVKSKLKISDLGILIPNNPEAVIVLFRFYNQTSFEIENINSDEVIFNGIRIEVDEDKGISVWKRDKNSGVELDRGFLTKLVKTQINDEFLAIIGHPSLKEEERVVVEII